MVLIEGVRREQPHLQVIVVEDAQASNRPQAAHPRAATD
jgi:hypothetical protein